MKKKILVAPMNWGLGHASRCVIIINFLIENNLKPVIASDGDALVFFRQEFPKLETIELPSYRIKYSKKGTWLKWKLLFSGFSVWSAVRKERNIVSEILASNEFVGVISDNRFGVFSDKVPSVYITHQVNVLSGITTKLTSWVHQGVISKFDVCWVPDSEGKNSLAGKLSDSPNRKDISLKYIGNLSRLENRSLSKKYDLLVLLSGPEPQRTLLENILLSELENYKGKVAFVRGVFNSSKKLSVPEYIEVFDCLLSAELEEVVNQSEIVIARSGYSTIMDLSKLNKKAFFIPTPGQTEQEYLAKSLEKKNFAPFSSQDEFDISQINKVQNYKGFTESQEETLLNNELLDVFTK